MVVGDHGVAEAAGDPCERVAEDGRADVADVHRLGDVRRGEVDDHRAAGPGHRHPEPRVGVLGLGAGGVGLRRDLEIDESRTGDVRAAEPRQVERRDHLLGQRARVRLARLGQRHRGIALVIAEAQVGGGDHRRGDAFAEHVLKGGREAGLEFLDEGHGKGIGWMGKRIGGRFTAGMTGTPCAKG